MPSKRIISILIPYQIKGQKIHVFLQKRGKDMERLPDFFGFFGGGKENEENSEETLLREIKEELDFRPNGYNLLGRYDFERSIKHIYILEVGDNFEKEVTVLEGEYGKYFDEEEALDEPRLIEEDKLVLRDLYKLLRLPK
jgi:8-oxo-dGTP pyrophosphatase MutT (NUDIX family)